MLYFCRVGSSWGHRAFFGSSWGKKVITPKSNVNKHKVHEVRQKYINVKYKVYIYTIS
jgi:hypothetical protein